MRLCEQRPMPIRPSNSYCVLFDGSRFRPDEEEFLEAITAYRQRYRRRYPTWCEVLYVLLCLGYRKVAAPVPFDQGLPEEAVAGGLRVPPEVLLGQLPAESRPQQRASA